ncbi:MAG: AraC family transcriptional regulator [Acetivibrionales bacterium]|jgi:effector-binding domain-containing protein
MIKVNKDCEYKMENVLSIRKKMTQQEIQQTLSDMGNVIATLGVNKNGPLVTTTYSMEQTPTGPILDMEILVPLDKEVTVSEPYILKPLFHLKYAVHARHEGNPQLLQNTLNQMMTYIQENKLTQITSVYSVNINELKQGDSMDDMVTDLYIGVNPSVL